VAAAELYDDIGAGYSLGRRTDPRWMTAILAALGDARSIADVGAGTGSYEPDDRTVVAFEPSIEMIRQRPSTAAPIVRAVAEALPVRDHAVDAALAGPTKQIHSFDCATPTSRPEITRSLTTSGNAPSPSSKNWTTPACPRRAPNSRRSTTATRSPDDIPPNGAADHSDERSSRYVTGHDQVIRAALGFGQGLPDIRQVTGS
jgi:hypothetical protein